MRGAALEPMLGQCYVNVDLFGAFLGAMSSPCLGHHFGPIGPILWPNVGPMLDLRRTHIWQLG